ncbi:hypothetical protein TREPR_1082 [Treponema primitia ZAS-2]|uniref:Uncharacterized protein n=1 Tax=Treponema primitia (strain ATCC BAA-887 / DSM 12427 / ZAS-2) TaxID=545694 RepID=F5YHC1_TREPZ|nr:hypothetical protein TREPR_1082 [Treponema primitia ZAS-2]
MLLKDKRFKKCYNKNMRIYTKKSGFLAVVPLCCLISPDTWFFK